MANRFWVGGTGTWAGTGNWSTSSGGASGASEPTSSDNVFFDANSFSAGGQVVNISGVRNCLSLDCTGVTNSPTITFHGFTDNLHVYGNLTLASTLTINSPVDFVGHITMSALSGSWTIDQKGASVSLSIFSLSPSGATTAIWTLASDLLLTKTAAGQAVTFSLAAGTFFANGFNVTSNTINMTACTIHMGSGIWTSDVQGENITSLTGFGFSYGNGGSPTLSADTSTLVMTDSSGGHTGLNALSISRAGMLLNIIHIKYSTNIYGFNNSLFASSLTVDGGSTVKFYFGYTYTVTSLTANGSPGNLITFRADTDGDQYSNSATNVSVSYIDVKDSIAAGTIPFVDFKGVNSGNNVNWSFAENLFLQNVFMVGADTDGDVQAINLGKSDDGNVIYYEVKTQEQEFGNRAHTKKITDKVVVFTKNALDGVISIQSDSGDFDPIIDNINNDVCVSPTLSATGHFFTLKWWGDTINSSPILQGFYIEKVTDEGLVYGQN